MFLSSQHLKSQNLIKKVLYKNFDLTVERRKIHGYQMFLTSETTFKETQSSYKIEELLRNF